MARYHIVKMSPTQPHATPTTPVCQSTGLLWFAEFPPPDKPFQFSEGHIRFFNVQQVCGAVEADADQDADTRDDWDLMPSLGFMMNGDMSCMSLHVPNEQFHKSEALFYKRNPELVKGSSRDSWNKNPLC